MAKRKHREHKESWKDHHNLFLLAIVGIVGVVGIIVLVLNAGSIALSDADYSGQVARARISIEHPAVSTTSSDDELTMDDVMGVLGSKISFVYLDDRNPDSCQTLCEDEDNTCILAGMNIIWEVGEGYLSVYEPLPCDVDPWDYSPIIEDFNLEDVEFNTYLACGCY